MGLKNFEEAIETVLAEAAYVVEENKATARVQYASLTWGGELPSAQNYEFAKEIMLKATEGLDGYSVACPSLVHINRYARGKGACG